MRTQVVSISRHKCTCTRRGVSRLIVVQIRHGIHETYNILRAFFKDILVNE